MRLPQDPDNICSGNIDLEVAGGPDAWSDMTMAQDRTPIVDAYAHGRRDGLRLALAILAAEEAKWSALLGESRSWRTNAIREVRHKTLQVAQSRVQTALNRLTPKDSNSISAELATALDLAGL